MVTNAISPYHIKEDYRKACDAHKDDKTVFVRGVIDKSERNYVVTDVHEFKILN
jgi:hypothetical protein